MTKATQDRNMQVQTFAKDQVSFKLRLEDDQHDAGSILKKILREN